MSVFVPTPVPVRAPFDTGAHIRRNMPLETALHPAVFAGLTVCLLWIVAAAWLVFGAERYLALQLAVMTFLALMFAGVPLWLARIGRGQEDADHVIHFHQWAEHDFMTASGPVEAKHAAIMVLLAPAAVALGITATLIIAKLAALGLL